MTDEDRLRKRLRDQVAAAAVVADLDDVAARIGARAHRRDRPLAAVALATLVVGTLGGFAVGTRHARHHALGDRRRPRKRGAAIDHDHSAAP